MEFNYSKVSPQLSAIIQSFIHEKDLSDNEEKLLLEIVGFAFAEGKIRGKEEILLGEETK